MKPIILDLRDHRCPLSLLLVKRKVSNLAEGVALRILIRDKASFCDIKLFLQQSDLSVSCEEVNDVFQIDVERDLIECSK